MVEGEAGRHGRAEAEFIAARVFGFLGFLLRNLPVLAIEAAENAAGGGEGKGAAAGQEMEQGLLLDRVNVEGAWIGIDQRVEGAVVVDLVAAMAAVAGGQDAIVGADLALDVAAKLEVVGGLLDPAALAPEFPDFAFGGVAFENVRRRFGVTPLGEEIEEGGRAGDAGDAGGAQPDGRATREDSVLGFGFRT